MTTLFAPFGALGSVSYTHLDVYKRQYLDWAVRAFRLSASPVVDSTQIHTHMCYSDFNLIIEAVAALEDVYKRQ